MPTADPQYILPLSSRYCYREGAISVAGGASGTLVLPCPINGKILGIAAGQSATSAANVTVAIGATNVTGLAAVAMGTADTTYTALATANNLVQRDTPVASPIKVTFQNTGATAAVFTVRVDLLSSQ